MPTYYVDPVAGANGNSGAQGSAKQTLKGFETAPAITLVNDDVIVLVNSGNHEWPLTANEYTITKRVTIRGGTALGVNAEATIWSSSDVGARRYIQAGAAADITFENIVLDATATTVDADPYDFLRYNNATAKQKFRGCSLLGSAIGGSVAAGFRRFFNQISNPGTGVDTVEFYRCYMQNAAAPALLGGVHDNVFNECVFIGTLGTLSWLSKVIAAGTGGELAFTQCTVYVNAGAAALGAILTYNNGGTTAPLTAHSNLVWMDSTDILPLIGFIRDSAGTGAATGTRDYNVLLGGPNIVAGDLYSNGWYEKSWDPNQNDATGADTYTNDQVAYGQAANTIFNNPAGTFAWSTVNGLTIVLPLDLRPRLYLTASQSGGVPGALPPAETDLSVSVVVDVTAPDPDDTVVLTVTAANAGTNAASVVYSAPIPAGLTLVSAVPSAGTYLAGVWTIGALADGADETLVLTVTVDSDQAGNDITFTASVTSGDPANDPDLSNNTASRVLSVQEPDVEDNPTETPFLDVAPLYAPVLLAEINAIIRTKRNKITQHELRRDFEDRSWREFKTMYITVAPSTTTIFSSAIERVDFLILESTAAIEVSVSSGDVDQYLPAATRLSVLDGDFTTLKLRNPSASTPADVLLVVID